MQPVKTSFHPDVSPLDIGYPSKHSLIVRHAARAIVVKNENILLLYTQRYDDYSLPGGGIDESEDEIAGLIRELAEETGATGIHNIQAFVRYDEYRPWYKADADIIHMVSHCYTCDIDEELGETKFESHEIANVMTPMWVNVYAAIEHNEKVIANSTKKGLSIERETFLLKMIAEKLICN